MSADDASWVFDSLIGFLQGPVWSAPILTFIEEKSAIFDAEFGADNEEEYQKIHEDYKNLVDNILGSLMDDLGISPEQFEEACSQRPPEGAMPHFHKSLFEQVWAANDYQIFRRMMLQKNVELQLQTLEMIRQQTGVIPECCRPGDDTGAAQGGEEDLAAADEAQIMDEVLRRSLEEFEAQRPELDAGTLELQQQVAAPEEVQRLREEVRRERRRLDSALHHTLEAEAAEEGTAPAEAAEEADEEPDEAPAEAAEEDAEALAQRRAYLQAQRDRLLALKKSERERQLRDSGAAAGGGVGSAAEDAGAGAAPARPRSAQAAAQRALAGQARPVSARTLAVRRALADRLRAEVVSGR